LFDPEQLPRSSIGHGVYKCLKCLSFHLWAGKEIGTLRMEGPRSMVSRFQRLSNEAGTNLTRVASILKYLKWIKFPKMEGSYSNSFLQNPILELI